MSGKICKKIRGIKRYYSYLKSNGCKKNDLEKIGENSKGGPCGNYDECDRSNVLNLFCGEPLFKFNPIIHVLEKNSKDESFTARIVEKNFLKITFEENRNQAFIIISTGLITIILFFVTSPLSSFLFNGAWGSWLKGIFERVSTATLVSCLVGYLELILKWSYLVKVAPIKWYSK